MIYILSIFSSLGTFFLRDRYKINSIQASVLISLFGYFLSFLFLRSDTDLYSAVVYGASFVGMTNIREFRYTQLILSSLLYASMFSLYMNWFSGLGGALGFSAFISVTLIYFLYRAIAKFIG